MAEVKILVKGYVKEEGDVELASSTVVLIKDNGLNIIVDPGMNRDLLLEALKKEKLKPEDIDYVILTHYHLDHSLLSGIFMNSQVFDNSNIYSFDGKIIEYEDIIPKTNLRIIKTPGHDMFHCSVLAETEKFGKVIIVGDVFWWSDDEEQKTDKKSLINHEDPYMKNKDELVESREKILLIADYIIPGHGNMFKVKK